MNSWVLNSWVLVRFHPKLINWKLCVVVWLDTEGGEQPSCSLIPLESEGSLWPCEAPYRSHKYGGRCTLDNYMHLYSKRCKS